MELFNDFLNYVLLTKKDKKLFLFIPEKFYDNVTGILEESDKYRITRAPIVYCTPVFNMKKWDGGLQGKEWKKLRNIKNKFLKHHNVEFIPSKEVEKKKLIEVVCHL